MSTTRKRNTQAGGGASTRPDGRRRRTERHISVRAVRRNSPDIQKLGRAIIRLAVMEAEAERAAQAAHSTAEIAATVDEQMGRAGEVDHDQ